MDEKDFSNLDDSLYTGSDNGVNAPFKKDSMVLLQIIDERIPDTEYYKQYAESVKKDKKNAETIGMPYEPPPLDKKKAGIGFLCAIVGYEVEEDGESNVLPTFWRDEFGIMQEPKFPTYIRIEQLPPNELKDKIIWYGENKDKRFYYNDANNRALVVGPVINNDYQTTDLLPKAEPPWLSMDPNYGTKRYIEDIREEEFEEFAEKLDIEEKRKTAWLNALQKWDSLDNNTALIYLNRYLARRYCMAHKLGDEVVIVPPRIGVTFWAKVTKLEGWDIKIATIRRGADTNWKYVIHSKFDSYPPDEESIALAEEIKTLRENNIKQREEDKKRKRQEAIEKGKSTIEEAF